MRRVVLYFTRSAAWLADLFAIVEHLADFLAVVENMWFERAVYFSTSPECETEGRFIPSGDVVLVIEDVTDRQVPILIDVVDKVVHVVRTGLVGMDFRHFHFAGEERHVAAHQFVPHLD